MSRPVVEQQRRLRPGLLVGRAITLSLIFPEGQ